MPIRQCLISILRVKTSYKQNPLLIKKAGDFVLSKSQLFCILKRFANISGRGT